MAKKSNHKSNKKIGLPPGALVYTGLPKEGETGISLVSFNQETAAMQTSGSFEEIISNFREDRVNWINFDSLHNTSLIEEAGHWANIHSLVLEDILDVSHQPKIEEYDNFFFFTMKMPEHFNEGQEYRFDHISFVLGKNYLLTFQEHRGDPFEPIRDRIANAKGKIRNRGADYLFILLLDAIVDQYFIILDRIGNEGAQIEIELIENPAESAVNKIINLKKELNVLRENIFPLSESIKLFRIEECDFISDEYTNYFNDVKDHLKQISDNINNQRESLTALMELYMIRVSNQMNQVMKTLTIIATIFIPLTFVVGIYGMNFRYMPELEWRWGYPLLIVLMLVGGIGWYIYMRMRKWF